MNVLDRTGDHDTPRTDGVRDWDECQRLRATFLSRDESPHPNAAWQDFADSLGPACDRPDAL